MEELLGRCERVGTPLRRWADEALAVRGVRAVRLIQGVLALARNVPRETMLRAAELARRDRLYRYQHLKQLVDPQPPEPKTLIADHPAIRSLADYRLEDYR